MNASLALAFGAGLLATMNPCGFALLPSFLSLYLEAEDEPGDGGASLLPRVAQGFVVGVVLSASFGAVLVLAGLIISAGLRSFLDLVPWLAAAIGVALLALGLAMLAGRHVGLLPASRMRVRAGQAQGHRRVALFGATYALASLSCTLGLFLVVVGQALATESAFGLVAVFAAYAAGSASLLIALSLSAALAKAALARTLRRLLPIVNRVAGALLAVSGAYLLLYWLPALRGDAIPDSPLIQLSGRISGALSGFFSQQATVFAIALAVLAVTGIVAIAFESRRRAARAELAIPKSEASPRV